MCLSILISAWALVGTRLTHTHNRCIAVVWACIALCTLLSDCTLVHYTYVCPLSLALHQYVRPSSSTSPPTVKTPWQQPDSKTQVYHVRAKSTNKRAICTSYWQTGDNVREITVSQSYATRQDTKGKLSNLIHNHYPKCTLWLHLVACYCKNVYNFFNVGHHLDPPQFQRPSLTTGS